MNKQSNSINAEGWCSIARKIDSPNFDLRTARAIVDLLVIHNISLPPGEFHGDDVIALFINQLDMHTHPFYKTLSGVKVSSHFWIRRTGELIQFVSCDKRAWHAGVSEWQGRSACNDFSIGVELEGTDSTPYTPAQYSRLIDLIDVLKQNYPLKQAVGHSDIAPTRKTDPGKIFCWKNLIPCGLELPALKNP